MQETAYNRRKSIGMYVIFASIPFFFIMVPSLGQGCFAFLHPFVCMGVGVYMAIPKQPKTVTPLDESFGFTDSAFVAPAKAQSTNPLRLVPKLPTGLKWLIAFGINSGLLLIMTPMTLVRVLKLLVSGWDPSEALK